MPRLEAATAQTDDRALALEALRMRALFADDLGDAETARAAYASLRAADACALWARHNNLLEYEYDLPRQPDPRDRN